LIAVLRRAALVLPLFVNALAFACIDEPAERAPVLTREQPVVPPSVATPAIEATLADPTEPTDPTAGAEQPDTQLDPLPLAEPTPTPEPARDELAGELPSGPEPGSPESDAELLALLDDSTLTQEEFAKAFGSGKDPKIGDDEQFEFGAGDRSRDRSKVAIGTASVSAGKVASADIEALARGDLHDLEVCHAMALSKNAAELGRASLAIEIDAKGVVSGVEVESELSVALEDCLGSVAEGWKVAGGSKASVRLPLTLSTQ
jgi:hypothetical protein